MQFPIYIVERYSLPEYDSTSLTDCLRYIGRQMLGKTFGCLMVTIKEAMDAGFSIRVAL